MKDPTSEFEHSRSAPPGSSRVRRLEPLHVRKKPRNTLNRHGIVQGRTTAPYGAVACQCSQVLHLCTSEELLGQIG